MASITLGAILAGLPEFVTHSEELRPYALLYLMLGLALMFSIRISESGSSLLNSIGVALALAIAAATHLSTAFFLLALAPILLWPVRTLGTRRWVVALTPLVPAAVLLLWCRFAFVRSPGQMPEGWWVPPATPDQLFSEFAVAIGWNDLTRLAASASRHLHGAGMLIRAFGIAALAFAAWTSWVHKNGAMAWTLLASGVVYMVCLAIASWISEPLFLARTLMPGILPIAAGLALGLATNARPKQAAAAAVAVVAYIVLASLPGLRLAFNPPEGLRGLAAAVRAHYRPGDRVVLFRAMDYGLRPYWKDLSNSNPQLIDQTTPISPQLSRLRAALDTMDPGGRVLLVCRDDFYLQTHKAEFSRVFDELAHRGLTTREVWREADLALYESGRASHTRP